MNDLPSNQSPSSMNSDITRVNIPNFDSPALGPAKSSTEKLVDANTDRLDKIQNAINATDAESPEINTLLSSHSKLAKIDGLVDSILAKFPLKQPVTLVFVGCTTDAETDAVTAGVARRLAERRVGNVLLVDANPNSQALSENLGLAKSAGIGNVICDDESWQPLLQYGQVTGLDFLPYGNVSTSKALRSSTQNFLADAKPNYQFVCVTAGRNDTPIAKSFCNAADGIYLLVDLVQLSHVEAKAAADRILLNNLPLVGCIALDAEQDQQ